MLKSPARTRPSVPIRMRKGRLRLRLRGASRVLRLHQLMRVTSDRSAFSLRCVDMPSPPLHALYLSLMAAAIGTAANAADAPGMKHQICANDMPRPYATPAVANSPEVVPRPQGMLPAVPKGFAISVFASGLTNPRWMAVAPNGDVFLAEPRAGKITLLRDENGDGKADKTFTFATGFARPHGLAFHNGALYVGDVNAVWRLGYKDGATQAAGRERVTKQSFGGSGDHWSRDIAFGPNESLYVAIGSGANVEMGEPPQRATVQ